jgi:hypothetical protein
LASGKKAWHCTRAPQVRLQKLLNFGKALSSTSILETGDAGDGKFEAMYSQAVQASMRALVAGRTLVSIASTVKLILATLPSETKAGQGESCSAGSLLSSASLFHMMLNRSPHCCALQ